ncbi:YqaJ viral recombinase family protein [Mycobacterium sp. PSTR-4-N]|uniref:YqaJ viral recombinase family protein n=1 Tax=Mycobacterium sp. PSTR-4-N TaxID=2917745 RepID=UPI001F152E0F|nr:YqaJ viral recombinase family protein [Mycobacterium sp. PSTR-4-N]MCG7596314.1 YqaJ viral recombinase family protein [Mycobacterium sp. PSTR-4-N]
MLKIHPDMPQGSDEWLDIRRGIVTASAVGQLLSIGRLGAIAYQCPACLAPAQEPCLSKSTGRAIKTAHSERVDFAREQDSPPIPEVAHNDTSRALTFLLAAERITGWTDPTYVSDDMLRGISDEPIARDLYSKHYAPVTEVGFMVEDRWGHQIGYSPDGLVGEDGLIEIKSRRAKVQLQTILADQVPIENMAQCQCALLVSGRQWLDYVSYCGGTPLYVKRVEPQQVWFDAILAATAEFEENASAIIRTYNESVIDLHMTERRFEQEIVI